MFLVVGAVEVICILVFMSAMFNSLNEQKTMESRKLNIVVALITFVIIMLTMSLSRGF